MNGCSGNSESARALLLRKQPTFQWTMRKNQLGTSLDLENKRGIRILLQLKDIVIDILLSMIRGLIFHCSLPTNSVIRNSGENVEVLVSARPQCQ